MARDEQLRQVVAPILTDLQVDLYDLEDTGGVVRVIVDRPGGADIGVIAQATRQISRAFDDIDVLSGHYTLEVSSPGLERTLRTATHFVGAIGQSVTVKTVPGLEGDRRVRGELTAADAEGIVIHSDDGVDRRLTLDQIAKARTVFDWGPTPAPKSNARRRTQQDPSSQKATAP